MGVGGKMDLLVSAIGIDLRRALERPPENALSELQG
jgi:hypothetical protein